MDTELRKDNMEKQSTKIPVYDDSETYIYDYFDGEWYCAHANSYTEEACCSTTGSSGYIECGCGGQDEVICPNQDCTGIEIKAKLEEK